MSEASRWRFWIDRGGTFTDVVARSPDGRLLSDKWLSDDPQRAEDAAIAAMRAMNGGGALPHADIRMGTTVATNALLTRTGTPTLLAMTRGLGDALTIGTQERADIFARAIVRAAPLHAMVAEIDERVDAAGRVIQPLDEDAARAAFAEARAAGIEAIAIVLMHGWRHDAHERRLGEMAGEMGFLQISMSHEVAPLIRLVGRGDTTLADAYLSPTLARYIDRFCAELPPGSAPKFMQSSGGLTDHRRFRGRDAVLSGPAGGIVAMVESARALGFERLIGFDMGGTSTDVSHFAGHLERDEETVVAGTRLRASMLRINTVASGGGSICRWDGARLRVGPESAGAVPGPAAYRRGGPLTITDCHVLLGRIQPDHFPKLFGPEGNQPIDVEVVRQGFEAMAAEVAADSGQVMTAEQLAEGCIAIAVTDMANAIKRVTIARGHDIAAADEGAGQGYALFSFGGAGGQHACLVAEALGVGTVLIHPLAGVMSAFGMGLARASAMREATLGLRVGSESEAALGERRQALLDETAAALAEDGEALAAQEVRLIVRLAGSDSGIELPDAPMADLPGLFAEAFRQQFGYPPEGDLVIERMRVEARGEADAAARDIAVTLPETSAPPLATIATRSSGVDVKAPLYARETLAEGPIGPTGMGPMIIVDPLATTIVERGWGAEVLADGTIRLTRRDQTEAPTQDAADAPVAIDPVRLEIFNALFMAIAEEMGGALQRSASSVNIRERLDFSCALFDGEGRLVANAPHMPVHLGSMGASIRAIMAHRLHDGRGFQPGDAYALNAPYDGGTHLPDITVVMPVFAGGGERPDFFVAARGHHADIGGIAPGSMPPDSRSVEDEGVLFDDVLILADGRFAEEAVRARLEAGPWPARNPTLNIADMKAQIAACLRGEGALQAMAAQHGLATVRAMMAAGQRQAEEAVRRLIGRLKDSRFRYAMDNGAEVAVAVSVDPAERQVTIDFTGSSEQRADNVNAPLPVVQAAVLYVLRIMLDDAIPMNDGCLAPVTLIVPEGSMLRPRHPAAVVAGNVETSQVITDALLGAFGAMAAAQGTMNNFTFGDADLQYYETIAGGAGAGPGFVGADAVQTHMTNSRLTDPEIIETRYPVLVERFAIRRGSGGAGRWRGGDGIERRIRFTRPMTAAILSNRRTIAPFGLAGGGDGAPGANRVRRADGRIEQLPATARVEMAAGDVFEIDTPGGGGFGGD